VTKQEAMQNFWQAQRELAQAQTAFDCADQDHAEVANYRLAAAEKNLGIAHHLRAAARLGLAKLPPALARKLR
jgi:hypothetical protein